MLTLQDERLRFIAEAALYAAIAWLFHQSLGILLDTPMPVVAVVSNSMEPILYKGDLLLVAGGDVKVRDIAVYQLNTGRQTVTIVHRIIGVTDHGYVFKGDNNKVPDPGFVRKDQIIGTVHIAMPLLGYPRTLLFDLVGI